MSILVPSRDPKVVENAMPLRWMFFDSEALEKHMDEIRGVLDG